jgi:predicted MFS family arabinose efflux permease
MLASYLHGRGFTAFEISAIVTGTLLGSAVLTLAVGLLGHRLSRRRLLFASTALMLATGVGFAVATDFWVLLVVAVVGTMNPTAGDVSVFLPTEQSLLSEAGADRDRTSLFARYNLGGIFAAALGSLVVGVPVAVARLADWPLVEVQRASFLIYAAVAAVLVLVYARMTPDGDAAEGATPPRPAGPLRQSRGIVLRLSALFSLDAFGGGFVVQTLITLWLFERFDMDVGTAGAIFFVSGLLSALSQLASPWLAQRIGLINTMVWTHLPANTFLVLAALMPNAPLAIAFLLARMLLSAMDVPARQSYTMAVVPPEERAAAASVTNLPRSLASAFAPLLAGWLLTMGASGGPLIAGGVIKIVYDLLLLWQFRSHPPPEERRPAP